MTEQNQTVQPKIGRTGHFVPLAFLLLLYVIVALAHAYLAPLTTGPDELAHYEYVNFIAEQDRLPLDTQERAQASYKSDQPPLYHLIAAVPAGLVDPAGPPYLKRYSDHLRRQLIERTRHAWGLHNTEDERWPYRAEVLRWHVGRWVAIILGAATVAVTYFIAWDLFADVWLALGAGAVVAFVPRFALTGSMLNYETTLAFFSALFLWVLLKMANGDLLRNTQHAPRLTLYAILLGLLMGLSITAKLSALILLLEVFIALWLIGRYHGWTWKVWLRTVAITAVATLVAVSWWFGFIAYQFNTVAQDGLWVGLLRPLIAADTSDATTNRLLSFLTGGQAGFTGAIDNLDSGPPWEWLAVFFRTFWVVGIEGYQPLGWLGLVVALAMCLVAGYGLILVWRNDRRPSTADRRNNEDALSDSRSTLPIRHPARLILYLLLLHVAAAFILPLLRYASTLSLADTAQGRHVLFQAAPAVAILLVWGLRGAVVRGRWQVAGITPDITGGTEPTMPVPETTRLIYYLPRFICLVPGMFLFLWSGTQLWYMTWAYHPLLPVRTVSEAKAQAARQLDQPLNEYITLVGFDSQLEDTGMLRVDLFWQATEISPVDYLTELSLVDGQGGLQAQWLGYPAGGRYPTRAWDVGDIVRDTVWLPVAGLEWGQYHLNLDLIPTAQFPLSEPMSSQIAGPVTLPPVDLPSLPAISADPEFQIWQNGRVLTAPQTFRYRETILVTLDPSLVDPPRQVQLVGPDPESSLKVDPERDLGESVLFIVGPDWPTGDYRLQLTSAEDGQQQLTSEPLIKVIDRWERQFAPPPISHMVEANFANQVKLLGYDLAGNRAEPGGGIPLTLYWQGLDWMGEDYTIFTRLLAADQSSHGGRDRRPQEGYSTLYWAPGEIVTDPFGVPVDTDAPDGVYYLNVGLYKQVGDQAVSLALVQDGRPVDVTSVNIGPIKIGQALPDWTLETANPQVPLNQPLGAGPNLTLLGYDLTDENGQPIQNSTLDTQNLKLTLYWRSESPLPADYTTFVHLRNEAGETVAQQDQPPLNGAYPTSLWDPGEIIADEIVVPLPAELPAGEYRLVTGLYDLSTNTRLPVQGNPENSLMLGLVEVDR
jgi:hypothetical protein